jgi:hypothetical protein
MRREIKTYFLRDGQVRTIGRMSLGAKLRDIGRVEGGASGQKKAH